MEELLYRYFSGQLSDVEKLELFEKLDSDPAFKDEFIKIQNNYSLSQMLRNDKDLEFAQERLSKLKRQEKNIQIRRNIMRVSRYAAILLLIVGLFSLIQKYTSFLSTKITYTEYSAPIGLRKEIYLPDSTKVCLAPASKLRVPSKFIGDTRLVELDGEALFDVTSDKKKPFIVKTNKYKVKVLGTIFLVNDYSNNTSFKTSLLEGSVNVYNNKENILLEPGESVMLQNNKLEKSTSSMNDIHYLQSGVYEFDQQSLMQIVNMLSNWYKVEITINNKDLSKSQLSGKFRENDDLEAMLRAIQQIYPFKYNKTINGNVIEIY